ncbi:hypothetical protein BVRB_3g068560 [Beta vulgaris subsp. vulgaris]|nr:hypothetical protein BVRB_3g068560 [Beta vulgaris subsp. vulgaris]
MDPEIAKYVKDVNEVVKEFLDNWSWVDEKIAKSLEALAKLEEDEGMETMGYIGIIIQFRNQIEVATKEAKETVEVLETLM